MVVWLCHEERPGVCRKKGDGNEVSGKEEIRKVKEKISGCSEERYGEVGVRVKNIGDRTLWRSIIRCGNP